MDKWKWLNNVMKCFFILRTFKINDIFDRLPIILCNNIFKFIFLFLLQNPSGSGVINVDPKDSFAWKDKVRLMIKILIS